MTYRINSDGNGRIPDYGSAPEDLADLLSNLSTDAIGPSPWAAKTEPGEKVEAGQDIELDRRPSELAKSKDPLRIYLRQIGTVPLLTREGEVDIAKRIERGKN